jgi:type II secretory pathway predicted ATPase ExeA
MDPVSHSAIAASGRGRPSPPDPAPLPSRRAAREAIREALARGRGPVALTGEPGVGKTALWRGLEASRKAGEAWAAVEATPGGGRRELYRLIARETRVDPAWFGRPELLDLLAARSLDGERWTLVVDEAQNLDADALEEVRVLSNRLGMPDGFAAILLVGQTPLARRLLHRSGFALASRLSVHVHLRPLDADEVGLLLGAVAPGGDWSEEVVDRIHHATGGRPGLVVERAARVDVRPSLAVEPPRVAPAREAPLVGPARPPIRVEDGLIEVGWPAEPEPEPATASATAEAEEVGPAEESAGRPDGPINDHYAALQAWQEWATNQGRHPEVAAEAKRPDVRPMPAANPNVWADEEHGFSPFGRLFSRLPQEHESD